MQRLEGLYGHNVCQLYGELRCLSLICLSSREHLWGARPRTGHSTRARSETASTWDGMLERRRPPPQLSRTTVGRQTVCGRHPTGPAGAFRRTEIASVEALHGSPCLPNFLSRRLDTPSNPWHYISPFSITRVREITREYTSEMRVTV